MNLRIYKKLCKRGEALILANVPAHERPIIDRATGDETICPAVRLQEWSVAEWEHRRAKARGERHIPNAIRGYAQPLPGTPLIWEKTSYEYDEWDAKGAWDWWQQWHYWNTVTDAEIERMLGLMEPPRA